MNNSNRNQADYPDQIDKSVQRRAIAVVLGLIALLFLFSAWQTGLLDALCARPGQTEAPTAPSMGDTVASAGDALVSAGDGAVSETSHSDAVSDSGVNVVYYPEVHIEGITLPEEYGAGLFDAEAAVWLVNEYRRQNGLYALEPGTFGLEQVTRIRLDEVKTSFAHQRPDGSEFSSVYTQTGLLYIHCAENLALGQFTAEEVVRDWINSDSHRAILLSELVTHMCIMTGTNADGYAVWVLEAYAPMKNK